MERVCPHCGNVIDENTIKNQTELSFFESMFTSINVMPGPGFSGVMPFINSVNNICPYCRKTF
ncbi:hypothetical protein [Clostridium chauvoei]|uniref:Uncharacterized protein n=2 Tax=Clostridium chauvoei TaxID=46867 RepID=A0A1U6J960_9CLOT|nr:hypothetical protein [Clostridium chauvoei]ATD54850.1 hypothetical protein BTM20_06215 [Clostridium chauvoei]ATD57470.1 hypothetical protein BTM21_06845 [Clostridium chauvoei]MBX7281144.1 hypothetical protein [Clostridium chauvoei]MBX7283680.1 hypothetical protein [Clostridium chauvoei]MBX7286288.1 hypothetical protein [Clostridium chauvoei]